MNEMDTQVDFWTAAHHEEETCLQVYSQFNIQCMPSTCINRGAQAAHAKDGSGPGRGSGGLE